jgi:ankyrin repeat protein
MRKLQGLFWCLLFAGSLLGAQGSQPSAPTPDQRLLQAHTCAEIEKALSSGARLEARDDKGMTALNLAAREGWIAGAQLLIERKANLEAQNIAGLTPLIWASAQGHLEMVKLLADHGARLNKKDKFGFTAMHWAGTNDHLPIVVELLNRRAKILLLDRSHLPQAVYAAWLVKDALAPKIDPKNIEYPVHFDWPALAYAAQEGNLEAVRLLLDHGVSVDLGKDDTSPLEYAVQADKMETAQLLIARGANLEAVDEYRKTLLMRTVSAGRARMVRLLMEKGAKVNPHDKEGHTALYYARKEGTPEVIQLLEEHGAPE